MALAPGSGVLSAAPLSDLVLSAPPATAVVTNPTPAITVANLLPNQPAPQVRVLFSPRPGTAPYWWPITIQAAAIPTPPQTGQVIAGWNPQAITTVPVIPVMYGAAQAQTPAVGAVWFDFAPPTAAPTLGQFITAQAFAQTVQQGKVLWSPMAGAPSAVPSGLPGVVTPTGRWAQVAPTQKQATVNPTEQQGTA